MALLDYIIAPIPLRQTFLVASRLIINGSFSSNGSAVIIGRINGDVTVEESITLAKKGIINGNVKAANMTLKGTVVGNIYCEGKIKVAASANIKGNIVTGEIDVDKNAVIEGAIQKLTDKFVAEERNYFIETMMTTKVSVVPSEDTIVAPVPIIEELPKEKAAQTWF